MRLNLTPKTAREAIRSCEAMQDTGQLIEGSMLDHLVNFARWISDGNCMIRSIDAELIALLANDAQLILLATMMTQAYSGVPVRVIVLKARKRGISTFVQAMFYYLCVHEKLQIAKMLANLADSTHEIFEITHLMAEEHIKRGIASLYSEHSDTRNTLKFSETDSRYACHTAGTDGAAVGGSPNLLHLSEVALWKVNKEQAEMAAVNSVAMTCNSIIVYESTSRGRELFWKRYNDSHADDSMYCPVFIPWHFGEDVRLKKPIGFKRTQEEVDIQRRAFDTWGEIVPDEKLNWRRAKIRELGPEVFAREHPETPEDALRTREGLVLPGLRECIVDSLPHDIENLPSDMRVGGADFGFHHPTVLIDAVHDDDVLWIFRIHRAARKLAREHASAVWDGCTYFSDPSGAQPMREIREAAEDLGMRAEFVPCPRRPGPEVSIVEAEWEMVRLAVREGRLKILRGCADQLLVEADSLVYDERTGKPNTTTSDDCGHFDTLDALRYMVTGVRIVRGVALVPSNAGGRRISRRTALRSL